MYCKERKSKRKAVMLLRPRLPRIAVTSNRTRIHGPAATRHPLEQGSSREIVKK